jgi:hypothetical protein
MSRFAAPCSIEDLKKYIFDAAKKYDKVTRDDFEVGDLGCEFSEILHKNDLDKVSFDWENFEYTEQTREFHSRENTFMGYHTLSNGFSFLGCYAGGDWETPIYLIIYYSGTELRGYIPSKGNTYNLKTKKTYGHEDGDSGSSEDAPEPDFKLMLEDIQKRIIVKGNELDAEDAEKNQPSEIKLTLFVNKTEDSVENCQHSYMKLLQAVKKAGWTMTGETHTIETIEE